MKKSVLFLIAIICILSIFAVALFGAKASFDQFKVYIQEINITTYTTITASGDKKISLTIDPNVGEVSIFIDYEIKPTNATDKSNIEFSFISEHTRRADNGTVYFERENTTTGETEQIAAISKFGELTFFRQGAVFVKITSRDGLEVSDQVYVVCREITK